MVTLERIERSSLVGIRDATAAASPTKEAAIAQLVGAVTTPFSWSMRLLPAPRRTAMQALCAFSREVGGLADGNGSWTMKLALLADWRAEIALLYTGQPEHIVTRALHDAVERFDLLCEDFLAIIDGKEMDAADIRAPSLDYLDRYCEQRAVAVSRIALRILGAAPPDGGRLRSVAACNSPASCATSPRTPLDSASTCRANCCVSTPGEF